MLEAPPPYLRAVRPMGQAGSNAPSLKVRPQEAEQVVTIMNMYIILNTSKVTLCRLQNKIKANQLHSISFELRGINNMSLVYGVL